MRWSTLSTWLTAGSSLLSGANGILIDISNPQSVDQAAGTVAQNMLTYYNGTTPGYAPGILTNPYYWWEAGAMFGIFIHYWHLTGNTTYNDITQTGLLFQRGEQNNFEPANQTKDLGNDDQSFWAYAALDAAEFGFPNPPDTMPSWLSLAQAVFNRQINRWDNSTCGGGIRWQIYQFNPGYTYKNTAANGGLFHIAARLARYTGNQTYADNANKLWNWMTGVNFLQELGNSSIIVIDGSPTDGDCIGNKTDGLRWTYNHGTILMGAAYMYNYTNGSAIWRNRLQLLVEGARDFMVVPANGLQAPASGGNGTILSEVACEGPTPQTCKVDQPAFKAMLIRWLAVTTQLAPWTSQTIFPWLNGTARHAATQCVGSYGERWIDNAKPGGPIGTWCGRRWYNTTFDGFSGLGEQLSSMSAMQNVLIGNSMAPYTTVTGGNSTSNPDAGNEPTHPSILSFIYSTPVTKGDVAGAWILTVLGMIIIGVGAVWMVREEPDGSWAGAGPDAGWMAPSSGSAAYYKKTYGYGAYRLAGLSAGGVYKGKNSSARRAFAKPNQPTIGLGSGGWWFGTGQGVGEKWWDRKHEEHVDEVAEKMPPSGMQSTSSVNIPRDSMTSNDSKKGLFARLKGNGGSKPRSDLPGGKDEKAGEWKSIGNGVFVRAKDIGNGSSGRATPVSKSIEQTSTRAIQPARREDQSRSTSARQSRAPSVAKGRPLHWPSAPPEEDSEEE